VLLVKVPIHSTILDWTLYCVQGGTGQTVKLGTSASPSALAAAFSLSETFSTSLSAADFPGVKTLDNHRAPKGNLLPVRISVSDDTADPAHVWLHLTFVTTISATAVVNFGVQYSADGYPAHATVR